MKKNQNDLLWTRADIIIDRLILRPSDDVRDLADYLSHLEATDEYFIQYGEERSKALIEAIDFHSAPVYYYTVFRKDTGGMTGYVGITPLREQKAGNLEFYIFREFRRNRYAHTVWRGTYCKNHRYFLKISEGNSNGYSKHKRV